MAKKLIACCLALALLLAAAALGEGYRIAQGNQSNFGRLLIDLLHAYERPSGEDAQTIEAALEAIRSVNAGDYEVARAIADHWNRVYVNADGSYVQHLYDGDYRATALEQTALVDSPSHAFVVLGYELKNGEMTNELMGRCDAAAAAARSFPNTILVCSGGPTGKNNPEGHTEAGMMKRYLVDRCGIDASRIFIDEKAMSTVQNAVNTFAILRAQKVSTITLVTSSYHQRWGQVLYNAMAALCRQADDCEVDIVENFSYSVKAHGPFKEDDRLAIRQLTSMLGLSDEVLEQMKAAF